MSLVNELESIWDICNWSVKFFHCLTFTVKDLRLGNLANSLHSHKWSSWEFCHCSMSWKTCAMPYFFCLNYLWFCKKILECYSSFSGGWVVKDQDASLWVLRKAFLMLLTWQKLWGQEDFPSSLHPIHKMTDFIHKGSFTPCDFTLHLLNCYHYSLSVNVWHVSFQSYLPCDFLFIGKFKLYKVLIKILSAVWDFGFVPKSCVSLLNQTKKKIICISFFLLLSLQIYAMSHVHFIKFTQLCYGTSTFLRKWCQYTIFIWNEFLLYAFVNECVYWL